MLRRGVRPEILAAACAALVVLASIATLEAKPQAHTGTAAAPATPTPTPVPTVPPAVEQFHGVIGAIRTSRAVVVRAGPSARSTGLSAIRGGILLPVLSRNGDFVRVMTPCELVGFVPLYAAQPIAQEVRPAKSINSATIVIDPGHGGAESGATGPRGTKESLVNLDISRRLAVRLNGARVFLTRSADYMAGLGFRAAIANSLHADLFLSVHNNADPDGPSSKPGTETYYQIASPASKRLAGLSYEELLPALERLHARWVSDKDAGAKYRTNVHGLDYYGVLRHSGVPAVITESLYISNAPEEALLARASTRELIAEALGRAVDRYLTTTDPGSGFVTPLKRNEGPPFILPPTCRDPS